MDTPRIPNEVSRLLALADYAILDTLPEAAFDDVARLAAQICAAPMALVTFVDGTRQWNKAAVGTDLSVVPRKDSFCAWALAAQEAVFVVPNAQKDDRFAENPLVTAVSPVRFYAGIPLITLDGLAIGTLCVMDTRTRQLAPKQVAALRTLGRQVMNELELRRLTAENDQLRKTAVQAVKQPETEKDFFALLERVSDGFVALDANWHYIYLNSRGAAMLGRTPEELIGKNVWTEFPQATQDPSYHYYHEAMATQAPIFWENYYEPWDRWYAVRIYPSPDGLSVFFTDITELKFSAISAQSSQEKLQLAVKAANIGLWDWDLRTNQVYYSPEWKKHIGYEDHEITNDFGEWQSRVHPDDLETTLATVQAYIENPWPDYEILFRFRHKDGSYRWILTTASLLQDEAGKAYRMLGSHVDITERMKAEETIRRERDFSNTIIDSLPGVFYLYDENRRFLRWNKNFTQETGYSDAEMAERHPLDFFAEEERALLAERIQDVFSEGEAFVEADFVAKDGSRAPYYFTGLRTRIDDKVCLLGVGMDISVRKEIEKSLQEKERFLSAIVDTTPAIILIVDLELRKRIYVSGAVERLLGYSADELIAMETEQFLKLFHPEDLAFVMAQNNRIGMAAADDIFVYTYRMRRKDGSWCHLRSVDRPFLCNPDGSVKQKIGVAIDITAVKEAEESLRLSNEKYADLYENAPDMYASVDAATGKISQCNQTMIEVTGYRKEEIIGRPIFEIYHPDCLEAARAAFNQFKATGVVKDAQLQILCKDGRRLAVSLNVTAVRDANGKVVQSRSIWRDITERKKAEEELRQSEDRLHRAVTHAPFPIQIHADDGEILHMSQAWTDLTGYTREEISTVQKWAERAYGERQQEALVEINNLYDLTETKNEGEDTIIGKDGSIRVWEFSSTPLGRLEDGRRAVISMAADITSRKKAEEALRLLNSELENRVIRRTAELAEAKEQAEAADRLKSAFLAIMSHELRTPLNSIIGFTGIILQGMTGPLNEEQKKQLGMVQGSARHLLALINDVLDISKIEAGQLEVQLARFDMRALVEKAAASVSPQAVKKGLSLTVAIAAEVTKIKSDRRRVEQILINLLNNAIKFTYMGEVAVRCWLEDGRIHTEVRDTGVGIKKADLNKLFQPFSQLDSGPDRHADGTGLGLSICFKLVQLLGGDINVESEWLVGSKFTFSLPL